jgi:LptD protein
MLASWATPARSQKLESTVNYSARDSMRYDPASGTVYLYGDAWVQYKDVELKAERIVYDFNAGTVQAYGGLDSLGQVAGQPTFTQAANTFTADSVRYNFQSTQGIIRNVRTQEGEAFVLANMSKRLANEEVHNKGGTITTCDRPKPHFGFVVSRMIVVPDKRIVTGPAYMRLGKVPTPLAVPFALFPNHRSGAAGILVPVYGESRELGFYFLNGGFYTPLGHYADVQLTGDIYSKGSWSTRANVRYKERYRFGGAFEISSTTLLQGIPELPTSSTQRNFFVRWNHQADAKASLTDRFTATVNAGSSNNFTNNFNTGQRDYLSNTFASNVQWTHLWPGRPFTLGVGLRHSQNSQTRLFDITLPSVAFNVSRVFPGEWFRPGSASGAPKWYERIGANYSSSLDNRLSAKEEDLSLNNLPELMRGVQNGVRHTAAVNTSLKTVYFTLNPELRVTDRMYFTQLRKTALPGDTISTVTDTISRFAAPFEWNASVNFTSKIYGMYQFRGNGIKAIRHVITPTAGFTYRPDQSTEITGPFGTNGATSSYSPFDIGLYGKPAAGRSGAVTLNLVQSLEAKVRDRKADAETKELWKKIRLLDFVGISTSYDVFRDSLRWNPVAASLRTTLLNVLNLNVNSNFDPYAVDAQGGRVDRSELSTTGALARLTSAGLAAGLQLRSKRYGQALEETARNDQQVVGEANPDRGARLDLRMPWQLNANYSYDIGRGYVSGGVVETVRQSVLVNGDITLFQYWKLGASSGYDLSAKAFTPTALNLYWDLHCWEFNFNIIPIGIRQSFSFRINVKASILKDLKLEQRRPIKNDGELLF